MLTFIHLFIVPFVFCVLTKLHKKYSKAYCCAFYFVFVCANLLMGKICLFFLHHLYRCTLTLNQLGYMPVAFFCALVSSAIYCLVNKSNIIQIIKEKHTSTLLIKCIAFLLQTVFVLLYALVSFIAFIGYPVIDWINDNFGFTYQEILYTLTAPLGGTDTSIVYDCIESIQKYIILWGVFLLVSFIAFALMKRYKIKLALNNRGYRLKLNPIIVTIICFSLIGSVLKEAYDFTTQLKIPEYYANLNKETEIYEDYYVDPATACITAPKKKKNLIYILVESMETTYASKDVGGYQDINYIPHLTDIANENISFSDTDKLGGWKTSFGNGWTIGSVVSVTSGIPFAFSSEQNDMDKREYFAPGLSNLGDVLQKYNYYQEVLLGSDAVFAGQDKYFTQHGNYYVNDLKEARRLGCVPENYYVNWGYEDNKLFTFARERLSKLASQAQPFNLMMMTMDTHFPEGFVCDICDDTYPGRTETAISCVDRQIDSFVRWCKQQPFYENTTIVIAGDHPRMDQNLVAGATRRPIYNAFINATVDKAQLYQKNRIFTAMDMFPTTLAAMGFQIEGNRLGLGTNLLSNIKTLPEMMGFDQFNTEISQTSKYYKKFSEVQ